MIFEKIEIWKAKIAPTRKITNNSGIYAVLKGGYVVKGDRQGKSNYIFWKSLNVVSLKKGAFIQLLPRKIQFFSQKYARRRWFKITTPILQSFGIKVFVVPFFGQVYISRYVRKTEKFIEQLHKNTSFLKFYLICGSIQLIAYI